MTPTRRALLRALPWFAVGAPVLVSAVSAFALPNDGLPPPNVFIAPYGWPFRARDGEPYPVDKWFEHVDKNHDGKMDKAEYMADVALFFDFLDTNKDGVLGPPEVGFYERQIAPEVLGARVEVSALFGRTDQARLWLAQSQSSVHAPPSIDPSGDGPDTNAPPHHQKLDDSGEGAAPYSFFDEPEPVTAADLNFTGLVTRANFLKLAEIHFTNLDKGNEGFLTLAKLPKTPVQNMLEKHRSR